MEVTISHDLWIMWLRPSAFVIHNQLPAMGCGFCGLHSDGSHPTERTIGRRLRFGRGDWSSREWEGLGFCRSAEEQRRSMPQGSGFLVALRSADLKSQSGQRWHGRRQCGRAAQRCGWVAGNRAAGDLLCLFC
ncbi:hypothetical protein TIFTF001_023569 [Ficus carica]|uniref:Uncharacterized protein n=1 Tax=Ficus carica TaxID=3494 RepID=A0AA88AL63_FICCA|nr:hypothetical protein TIFTF001_023569 [Ficus carica]